MSTHRLERVQTLISQTISTMLIRGEIKDPRVSSLVSVSQVSVAKDLSYAKISIAGFVEEKDLKLAVAGLNNAAGFIQAQVAKSLQTRLTPKLSFQADLSVKQAFEMTKKIEDLIHGTSHVGDDPSQ